MECFKFLRKTGKLPSVCLRIQYQQFKISRKATYFPESIIPTWCNKVHPKCALLEQLLNCK